MALAARRLVRERAAHRCEYCRLEQPQAPFVAFHVEHVVPRKHGGSDAPDNLALACQHCNSHKGTNLTGIDPLTRQITVLFNPRTNAWEEHFRADEVWIRGLTPVGRTTVIVSGMNLPERLELRAELGAGH